MKSTDADAIVAVLRKLADTIKQCEPLTLESILEGDFTVEIVPRTNDGSKRGKVRDALEQPNMRSAAEKLRQAPDRDTGVAVLDAECPSKDHLLALARHLDLPVQKRESIERIRDKIIEFTIGFRLRSRAIQGRPREPASSG